jgi:hypothetical protein
MEMPSRLASRIKNFRCGSVKEIICLVIRRQKIFNFSDHLVDLLSFPKQACTSLFKTACNPLWVSRLFDVHGLWWMRASVVETQLIAWCDPLATLFPFLGRSAPAYGRRARVRAVKRTQFPLNPLRCCFLRVLRCGPALGVCPAAPLNEVPVNAFATWHISPESHELLRALTHLTSIPQGIPCHA